jgi:hypothetical protein
MREVYAASFERPASGLERRSPDEALAPATLAPRVDPTALVVGDAVAAYPELAAGAARALPFATHHPRGGIVARLGAAILRDGGAADVGTLEPAYVRASQAELARRT